MFSLEKHNGAVQIWQACGLWIQKKAFKVLSLYAIAGLRRPTLVLVNFVLVYGELVLNR